MNTSESFRALRRANPRAGEGFEQRVEQAADAVLAQVTEGGAEAWLPARRRLTGLVAAAALAASAVVATVLAIGSPGGEDATAAVQRAAVVTAASAERSGTAVVRITHNGRLWAGSTIRWHGGDLSVTQDAPDRRGKVGSRSLLVDGMMYGIDPERGDWVELGPPESIDPGSGTTPGDYLAAVREDVGGVTLQRITAGMTAAATSRRADGATVYRGHVAAGLIATGSGFKDGQSLRAFPFGYVAHDEAADPAAPLDTAVTVGANDVIQELAVRWPGWTYTVTYRGLGSTSPPVAPANPRPLRRR